MIQLVADHAGLIGLLFFFGLFLGIAVWAYNPMNKKQLENHKYIPLTEDDA